MATTELRPAYLLMDDALPLNRASLLTIQKIIACAIKCYEAFDPSVLDVSASDLEALKTKIDEFSSSHVTNVTLSRGMRSDLCSVLSTIWDEHPNLYPKLLDVDRETIFQLQEQAYGHLK